MPRTHSKPDSTIIGIDSNTWLRFLALVGVTLGVGACAPEGMPEDGSGIAEAQSELRGFEQLPQAKGCGFELSAQYHSRWRRDGYYGLLELTNVSAPTATDFELFLDVGGGKMSMCLLADCDKADGGYRITPPGRGNHFKLKRGHTLPIAFMSRDPYTGIAPYIISVNGVRCDAAAPTVALSANDTFFTEAGLLSLSATAADNAGVSKVVFLRDGAAISMDAAAPYTLELPIDAAANGRHVYSAVAYDHSGNNAESKGVRVFTSIDNKFFGTAPDGAADYTHLLANFNQVTPANSGKWGTVEATRDQMNWTNLDTAYAFAKSNGLPFKLHTLVWGQQQPAWLAGLSPEAQLAEIEQWMRLAAERYPSVDMVDVVNEPLHAVPEYSGALGGAGATGWDWVIKSFELARKYFPKAELLLNDYNIEALDSATTDYLRIIDVLRERGLIDGIGLQAHFLERAEVSVVAGNLDRLAATNLPIYISELDVNFANDARQALRMRELFTLFWEHPAVVGVTHWGHLQGATWQSDAYLIRGDGSNRPALDWIQCFRAGSPNCPLPAYVPSPRTGDKNGLTIQAEDYDDAQGLLATGDVIAYTDEGDWASYRRVVFDGNWDRASVTYAKGSPQASSLSIHLGSVDSPAVATVSLENTGGWGTSQTVHVPFLPISGEHDVFVRFHGGSGVANVDKIEFGAPSSLGPNLLANGHFESDTSGWFTWNGTLSSSSQHAASGNRSLRLSNRNGNGPAATSLTSLVVPGGKYVVSLFASIDGAPSANVNVTQKITCNGQDEYKWLVNPVLVEQGKFTELKGTLAIPDCDVTDVQIFAEGPAGGIDIYLDHVSLRAEQAANLVANGTFESGTAGWSTWNGGTLSASAARAHSGTRSLLVGNRTGNAPAATTLTNVVPGATYEVSFWVSVGQAASANVNLTSKIVCDGQASYAWLVNPVAVADGQWTELKGSLSIPNCNVSEVQIYAEGPPAGVDLYVDDVNVSLPVTSNLLNDGTFESSAGSWFTWGAGTLAVTQSRAHGGSKSLLFSNRTGNGPIARSLMGLVTPGKSYQVSLWTSIGGAATANVNITQKIGCDGTDSYAWLAAPVAVSDAGWVKLSGTLEVPNCNLTDVLIFAEGPGAGVDVYIDDAVVSP